MAEDMLEAAIACFRQKVRSGHACAMLLSNLNGNTLLAHAGLPLWPLLYIPLMLTRSPFSKRDRSFRASSRLYRSSAEYMYLTSFTLGMSKVTLLDQLLDRESFMHGLDCPLSMTRTVVHAVKLNLS